MPGNVVMDEHGRMKLCGFGTVLYMAPEMYDEDVCAFAMILFEVIVGAPRSSGRAKEPSGPM
jgi:hypothetical protein